MSFQQGLSGLRSAATNLEVIANNISNANTIGAKSSRAEFADLYAEAAGGQGSEGIGSTVAAVTQDHTQGSISTTGRNLDLAINGEGYFQIQVASQEGGQQVGSTQLYTRNGQFKTDKDGWIVTNDGARLLGYGADPATGAVRKGQLQELKIPDARLAQTASNEITQSFNLNSTDTIKAPAFDPLKGDSYNYSATIKVFDQLGQAVDVSTFYKKTAAGTWDVFATANGKKVPATGVKVGVVDFTASTSGDGPPVVAPTDPLLDRTTGLPVIVTPGSPPTVPPIIPLKANLLDAALNAGATNGVKYQFAVTGATDGKHDVHLNLTGVSQQAGEYSVSKLQQNGFPVGSLSSFSLDEQGILTAKYTNGQSVTTGQLAIASFRNPQGLQPVGGNAWKETQAVGNKVVDVPGSGNLGDLVAGAVEESNVDLTAELVNLITAQRTYQANAQSIKTQDQVTQTFLNMR
jgi:flagellar hook protein FlgE